jgi:hypothetical protein
VSAVAGHTEADYRGRAGRLYCRGANVGLDL